MVEMNKQTMRDGCLFQQDYPPPMVMWQFDRLPKHIRDRINDSPYRVCVFCVDEKRHDRPDPVGYIEEQIRSRGM